MTFDPPVRPDRWDAAWIWHPQATGAEPAYILLRNRFHLPNAVTNIRLQVSADERYILLLDGRPISRGPSRGDALRWHYRTVDTGPLSAGAHVLAGLARHLGAQAEVAQIGQCGGFILQAEGPFGNLLNTGSDSAGWLCRLDVSRRPGPQYYGGAFFRPLVTETIDGTLATWDFAAAECDPAGWVEPRRILAGEPAGVLDPGGPWWLIPDPLPEMEYTPEAFTRVARAINTDAAAWTRLLFDQTAITIPAHTTITVVLDRGHLTNAYPTLVASGGRGASIEAIWCEAGIDPQTQVKGNRNDLAGKQIVGHQDRFLPDGGQHRAFQTFWFRPFRYCQLTIRTEDAPLKVERFDLHFTGYPFERTATFEVGGADLDLPAIRDLGWRTLRLCAHETFFDCPHYEQLQYVGDTRVMQVITYLETGDDRLARKAIDDFHSSRLPNGLTASRWPCRLRQVIPPFSLYWIGMLHDFWRYRGDVAFVQGYLPTARGILDWFEAHLGKDDLLGPLPYWSFCDWTQGWPNGMPPGATEGGSALISLLFAQALGWAADLHQVVGRHANVQEMYKLRWRIERAVLATCWDPGKLAYADTPAKDTFSVHVQIQAVLNNTLTATDAARLLLSTVPDLGGTTPVTPLGTPYWYYYLFMAMKQAGLADCIVGLMAPWRHMLADGMTTCTEVFGPSRSDCHAWGSSPNVVFLTTILGVEPAAPGFAKVRIEPHPGSLDSVRGSVPTPKGPIHVSIDQTQAIVTLPTDVTGQFYRHDRPQGLQPGENRIHLA